MSNRIIVYKRCKFHARHKQADPVQLEARCRDCRRAGFVATMRARGCPVTMPKYGGKFPPIVSETALTMWERNAAAWHTPAETAVA